MKRTKQVVITKVVSRNIVWDAFAQIQNLLGRNLKSYEAMTARGVKQIEEDIKKQGLEFKWYRYQITQLTNGALVIMFYGEAFV